MFVDSFLEFFTVCGPVLVNCQWFCHFPFVNDISGFSLANKLCICCSTVQNETQEGCQAVWEEIPQMLPLSYFYAFLGRYLAFFIDLQCSAFGTPCANSPSLNIGVQGMGGNPIFLPNLIKRPLFWTDSFPFFFVVSPLGMHFSPGAFSHSLSLHCVPLLQRKLKKTPEDKKLFKKTEHWIVLYSCSLSVLSTDLPFQHAQSLEFHRRLFRPRAPF